MADNSAIEWTEQTVTVDRGGRRTRIYIRKNPDRPGRRRRREQASLGLAWCCDCKSWLPIAEIKQGRCRAHLAAADRLRYATRPEYRAERRAHAYRRKFGVEPVPDEGKEALLAMFDGECAYCDSRAEAWDHVVPISKGGTTSADNILPACTVCNSSKKDRDLIEWIDATGRTIKLLAFERLAHFQVIEP